MTIPDYQTCMLPLLKFASDQKEHSLREAVDQLGSKFELTDEEMREMLPSGQQAVFVNRMGWARTYLKQACLIEPTRRGYFRITDRGLKVLNENPETSSNWTVSEINDRPFGMKVK
jgi:restriction system protein